MTETFYDFFTCTLHKRLPSSSFQIIQRHLRSFQNISKHFRTIQNISEHFRTFQNTIEHFRTFQMNEKKERIYSKLAKHCLVPVRVISQLLPVRVQITRKGSLNQSPVRVHSIKASWLKTTLYAITRTSWVFLARQD